MISKKVKIINQLGLHARPCSMLVKTASKFRSDFRIRKDDMTVNGKSILGVMMLAAECGCVIELILDGVDQEEALVEIENIILLKFDEE
jgi:phosphocarrier protein